MPQVIKAWKEQTSKPTVIVVDNTGFRKGEVFNIRQPYPDANLDGADDVWRITTNLGCSCNFYPALASPQYHHVLFADDDHIPGPNCLNHMLNWAERLGGNFASVGQTGRNFLLDWGPGKRYSGRSVPSLFVQGCAPCHITCRAHLVRNDLLPHVFAFRQSLLNKFGEEADRLCKIHNDFVMCLGIQMATDLKSYCIQAHNPEDKLFMEDLDNDGRGLWKRPEHFSERNRMVDMALAVGWREVR